MQLVVYDVECFSFDWLVVFKDIKSGTYTVIHNDNEALKMSISEDAIYIGFNNKFYDQYIVKAIASNCTPTQIKEINDFIIAGNQGWRHPHIQNSYYAFNNVDLKDDMQKGLSLKAIEGHLGLSVRETTVSFDIDRPLTQSELEETIFYCKYDVDTTERLLELRKDYLKTKINLGKRANIPPEKAMAMTNAKLTAKLLGAVKREWKDGREYVYPENLDLSIVPNELLQFFETIHDKSIPEEKLFKTFLEIDIGGMLTKYAWGGVHGSLTNYYEASNDTRILQNRDVSSLYPALIVEYDYLSRNVPNREIYKSIKDERISAKHNGDKQLSNDLKLPLNTVTGAQENEFNDLYDPLPTRSLRISGQLFLTVLAMRLVEACKTIRILNYNTDGLLYSIDRYELPIVDQICLEWEKETRFELETENVDRIWIKDVNNYIEVQSGGEIKLKGGYLVRGMITDHSDPLSGKSGGAWNINNNARIVSLAIKEYFINSTEAEETINNCNDLFQFQIIAKAGQKYKDAYHMVDGEHVPIQKVNRVYATADERYGKLFKVKSETDASAKIEMLPEHCIIDNDNQLTIKDINKTFYIELAKKRINDFKGINPEKKKRTKSESTPNRVENKEKVRSKKEMATPTKVSGNVYQKLLRARLLFLKSDVQKTGKNMNLSFKYFELDDIVPSATRIFEEVGLLSVVNFTSETSTMSIINTDAIDEIIYFSAPFNQIAPILSNAGKAVTNEMQALGSSITYMRRYLYMLALDICEPDSIDANLGAASVQEIPVKPRLPVSTEQREETKQTLTNPDGNASSLQIKQLKIALKKLKETRPEKEEFIAKLAIDTNGFTTISKTDCENILTGISKLLNTVEA